VGIYSSNRLKLAQLLGQLGRLSHLGLVFERLLVGRLRARGPAEDHGRREERRDQAREAARLALLDLRRERREVGPERCNTGT
jgi:hypothetical protein